MSSSSTNTLGKYQIVREIARSNDIVYEAIDPSINRRIALKELSIPPNLTAIQRRERVERFLREGRAAGKLAHPNIVTIYEVGKDGDRYFIAMEFLEGQNLRETLQAGGALSIRDAVNYTTQLCVALSYAHQNGIIHRDIKPDNVQILPGGHVKLTDFGIARMLGESSITQDGQVFGTPSYMSPEQVAGREMDQRSDIFSLGVMLYEMIAGKKPFTGDSVVTITYNIVNTEATPPPGAPPYLVGIIRKAMAKDPNIRYSSIEELLADLKEEKSSGGFAVNAHVTGSWPSSPVGVPPGPFQPQPPAPSQQPVPPLTPYGTPMPSPNAGGPVPDPFAQGGHVPVSLPHSNPSGSLMSPETRNFLGVFLLTVAFTGMLVFAVWAVRLAFVGFQTSVTSGPAEEHLQRGDAALKRGDRESAVTEWTASVRTSPNSRAAQTARNRIYEVSVALAEECFRANDYPALEVQAKRLLEAMPSRPEGYYYLAVARDYQGDRAGAMSNYELAIVRGGNDAYAQGARKRVGYLYLNEGDRSAAQGQRSSAIEAYTKARDYGDAETMRVAQEKIVELSR